MICEQQWSWGKRRRTQGDAELVYSEALLELCPLPGVAVPKLLSPLRQGLLKLSLESQTLPTHLSGWGTASPTEGAEPG